MHRFRHIDGAWEVRLDNEDETGRLGAGLSLVLAAGDVLDLRGGLGAGKTALARAIINALAPEGAPVEVPSPTFTLLQPYDFTRVPVAHFDFYRLQTPDEVVELGFEDMLESSAVLMEWGDRLGDFLPPDRLEVRLEMEGDGAERRAVLRGHGAWAGKLARFVAAAAFIAKSDFAACRRRFLQGDASSRRYERRHLHGHAFANGHGTGRRRLALRRGRAPGG